MNWNDVFDYRDGVLLWAIRPARRVKIGDVAGYQNNQGYLVVRFSGKQWKVHRIIWEIHNGIIPDNMEIDHINHKRDDNRIENLRITSGRVNSMNIAISSANSSGCMGVSWIDRISKWQVYIGVNGKQIYIGVFENFEDAVLARKSAEKIYRFHKNHGEKK